jgi:chromosome segregation ATPase
MRKSNVADAITWVLGEQSARACAANGWKTIFKRERCAKPTGAAEVRLRLSDVLLTQAGGALPLVAPHEPLDDEKPRSVRTVEVTRRLYRSGRANT